MRVSHAVPTNEALVHFCSNDSRETFLRAYSRHSYECRLILLSRQIDARCLHVFCQTTFVRHSHCKFYKISRRQVCDTHTNVVRLSDDNRATVLRQIFIRKTAPPQTPLSFYSKPGVRRGIPIFLIFAPKHRLWVLVRTASPRRF